MDHRSSHARGYGPTVVLTSRSGVVSPMEWDAFPAGAVTRGRAGRMSQVGTGRPPPAENIVTVKATSVAFAAVTQYWSLYWSL